MPRKNRSTKAVERVPQARPLTDFQELVCNLGADLILNGGEERDVSNLLRAAIGHSLHLRFPERGDWHAVRISEDLPDWRKRLARYWPAKTEAENGTDRPPSTVTEMVRSNVRGDLERRFSDFMATARMHELYLMQNVMETFESYAGGSDSDSAESVLAQAFMEELGSDHTYLKIPRNQAEAVEEFLKTVDEPGEPPQESLGRPKLVVFAPRQLGPEVSHAS